MDTTTINISGMSCGHCVAAVRKALEAVPGLTVHEVSIGAARIDIDPTVTTLSNAEAAIDAAGYDVVSGRVLNVAPTSPRSIAPDA